MIHKVARTGLVLFLAIVVATPFPLLAQNDSSNQTKTSSKDEDKDKSKSKSKSKKKNSDVENIGNRNINKGSINFFSLEKEIQMGRQLAAEIERQVKLVEDPTINEYVNRVGQNIVRNSDAKVPFTIKVVESDEINAFALPGGFFYVNSGLILAADDESELAAVMAHEIAHVAARHGTKQASKAELINFASIPLIFMGGVGGFARLRDSSSRCNSSNSRAAMRPRPITSDCNICIRPATIRARQSASSRNSRRRKAQNPEASRRCSVRIRPPATASR